MAKTPRSQPDLKGPAPPRDTTARAVREGVFRWRHDYSATDEDIERAAEEFVRRSPKRDEQEPAK